MEQLKMYKLASDPFIEQTLPEGYAFTHFSYAREAEDIHDWNECIRTWDESDVSEYDRFKCEIYDFKDIVPERDVWFLDYEGEHVGTATSFMIGDSGVGDMHWVGIKREYRGRGLAKYLCWIIEKTLRERGAKYISLTTGEGRPAAVKSYLTAGYLPVEYDVGMQERWEKMLDKFGIDSVLMLNEDGTPFKTLTRPAHTD